MNLELLKFDTIQEGLETLLGKSFLMAENMNARLKTPILPDGPDIWKSWLDSKTLLLYGGLNEDGLFRFKIDNAPDLALIANKTIFRYGSTPISNRDYAKSQGTEFIIIPQENVREAKTTYTIRTDKYNSVRKDAVDGVIDASILESLGGSKLNWPLTPEEAKKHAVWQELAVGKNNASKTQYEKSSAMLRSYVAKAEITGCFSTEGKGMYCDIYNNEKKSAAEPWRLDYSGRWSLAICRNTLEADGRFLSVQGNAAESDAQKIDPNFKGAYDALIKGAPVLHTPNGDYVLAAGRISKGRK